MRKHEVSTYREGKTRWTVLELEIDDDADPVAYYLTVVGATSNDKEWELSKSITLWSPAEVREVLRDKQGRLSSPAEELLSWLET